MSWSGTVTCSHCYTRGHNKRKCPTLTQSYLDKYKQYMGWAEGHADPIVSDQYRREADRFRKQYMKRTKIDPATG